MMSTETLLMEPAEGKRDFTDIGEGKRDLTDVDRL